jgi:hypothetical protein
MSAKVTYLDQNHWIALSRAAYGRASRTETPVVLEALRQALSIGTRLFPAIVCSLPRNIETGGSREVGPPGELYA